MSNNSTRPSNLPPAPATPEPKRRKSATPKPKADAEPANFPLCGCGCGVPVVTAKATFLSGHDARFAGKVGRGEVDPDARQLEILKASPKLQAKVASVAGTKLRKEAEKAAKAAAREAAKAAYEAALSA